MSCRTKEGQPLRGPEGVEHDLERQAHGVGQHRFVLGVDGILAADEPVRHVDANRLLAARVAQPNHV
jgi:hypothetical protein